MPFTSISNGKQLTSKECGEKNAFGKDLQKTWLGTVCHYDNGATRVQWGEIASAGNRGQGEIREEALSKMIQKKRERERDGGGGGGSDVCSVTVYISQSNTCIYVTARYLKGTCHINPHAANVKNNRE